MTVVGAGPRPFPLARVDFYFNGKPLAVATSAPFAATLPIETITQPGTYPVKFIAYDESGHPLLPYILETNLTFPPFYVPRAK